MTITEIYDLLPKQAKQEAADFIEFLAQKYLKLSPQKNHKKDISNFSGAWKEMKESDYNDFVNEIYERRKNSFVNIQTMND